jgi:hypothetical protein
LATSCGAVGEHTLVEYGLELCTGKVNGGSVRTRAGADNWKAVSTTRPFSSWILPIHVLTTLECTILAEFVQLTRNGVENGLEKTEGGGGDCW